MSNQPQGYGYGQQPVYPPPPQGQPNPHGNVVVVTQPAGRTAAPGSCRHCGIGYPHTSFSVLGIIVAILFFPMGIICCLLLQETRCSHCNARL